MSPERIEDDIVAFVRAADARSFTVAAEQLGLSRSTIGKFESVAAARSSGAFPRS
jgi:hypothetical protein